MRTCTTYELVSQRSTLDQRGGATDFYRRSNLRRAEGRTIRQPSNVSTAATAECRSPPDKSVPGRVPLRGTGLLRYASSCCASRPFGLPSLTQRGWPAMPVGQEPPDRGGVGCLAVPFTVPRRSRRQGLRARVAALAAWRPSSNPDGCAAACWCRSRAIPPDTPEPTMSHVSFRFLLPIPSQPIPDGPRCRGPVPSRAVPRRCARAARRVLPASVRAVQRCRRRQAVKDYPAAASSGRWSTRCSPCCILDAQHTADYAQRCSAAR